MDGDQLDQPSEKYSIIFDRMFPYYMLMGMSYDEYWLATEDKLDLPKFYRETYKLVRKQMNEQAWLQGMYIYEALSVVMGNAFSKNSKARYSEHPYDLFSEDNKEKKKYDKGMQKMKEWMAAVNAKFKKTGGE